MWPDEVYALVCWKSDFVLLEFLAFVAPRNTTHFTNCTTRQLLFHDPYDQYEQYHLK